MTARLPLACCAALALVATGCKRSATRHQPESFSATPVQVLLVENRARPQTENVVGTVRSEVRAAIEAKVSGRIEQMLAAPGRKFMAGEVIARLEQRESQARYDQAVVIREQAGRDAARFQRLIVDQAVTPAEAEAAQSRFQIARTTVAELEATLAQNTITAPFTGVITRKLADVGDLALPGRAIAEIEDPARLQFEAGVPELFLNRVHLQDVLPVQIGTNQFPGTVSEIVPLIDPASRTFLIKLNLPANAPARSGQFGHAGIQVGEALSVHVPAAAVVQRGQLEFVNVVVSNRVQLRLVRTGRRMGGDVELLAGVDTGERLALPTDPPLRDGQPVQIQP